MALISDNILNTTGLLGYYQCNDNSFVDLTGKNPPLTVLPNASFSKEPSSIYFGGSAKSSNVQAGSNGIFKLEQPLSIKSIEAWVVVNEEIDLDTEHSGLLCVNSGSHNDDRIQVTINTGAVNFRCLTSLEREIMPVSYFSTRTPAHILIQYDENKDAMTVVVDGILINDAVKGNSFNNLVEGNFLSGGSFFTNNSYYGGGRFSHLAFYDRALTDTEIQERLNADYDLSFFCVNLNKPIWSNKETREQANPSHPKVQNLSQDSDISLIGKSGNYESILDKNGNQRPVGYYQSTVLINNVPTANRRVMCFTNNGQLVDETISDSNGDYRFDYLDLNKKYMFIAQYSNELNTPPDYAAVAADWQTPIPYKE